MCDHGIFINILFSMKNLKFIFLGNSQSLKEIGDYPVNAQENWVKESKSIFEKYCKSASMKYEQRNRVIGSEGNFYFTITPTNVFYLVLAKSDYPERQVFELIEEIQKENVPLLVDEKGELNKIGKQSLKNLVEAYQNPSSNKIAMVQSDLNDVKIEMRDNVKKVIGNLEDVQALDQRAARIKDGAKAFADDSNKLKRLTCWQNCKWTIILIVLVIGILLVIIVPIAMSSKGDSSSNNSSNTNHTRVLLEHDLNTRDRFI